MGNSTARPQTLWGSVIGDFFNFEIDLMARYISRLIEAKDGNEKN